jgi:hypothetical protein
MMGGHYAAPGDDRRWPTGLLVRCGGLHDGGRRAPARPFLAMGAHRFPLPMLRDALLVAAVAVLTVQALRRWVGDRYVVPSDSMQPVLNGDPAHGDAVFVDKTASAAGCGRGDLAVVRHPEQPGQQMVKRIAACGDESGESFIDILDGDVWLGADPQRMRRETKDPLVARAQRVPWAAWPAPASLLDASAAREEAGLLVLPPAAADAASLRGTFGSEARQLRRRNGKATPGGFVGTSRAVDASYVEVGGARGRSGDDVGVKDCGMELELAGGAPALLCTIDLREEALTFHWDPAAGRVALWRNGEDVEGAVLPARPGGASRIEFGLLDDRVFFAIDGNRDTMLVVPRRAEWRSADREGAIGGPRTHVHVGAVGGEPLRLRRLLVFHDVFAWRERIAGFPGDPGQWPREVPPGMWFLLGDNPFDSRDSRHFGAVPSRSFLGRPLLVLGPWPRCRWLP